MRRILNWNILVIAAAFAMGVTSCFKEPAMQPDATFSTNLNENTAYAGQSFYMYLDQTEGEFFTLFSGTSESKTYSPDDGTRSGTVVSASLDSFEVTLYNGGGVFPMTLVASSVGEFGEEYLQDVYSIDLTVIDDRTGFISFAVNKVEGVYSDDGSEIYFYTHDHADLSDVAPTFTLMSPEASVSVNGEEQVSGKTSHDFTPDNPGTGESKTITYTVTASNGETKDYGVKFILREASSEKTLLSLNSIGWGGTKFVLSAAEQSAKEVQLFYEPGSALTNVKMQADALGTMVIATDDDGEEVDILPTDERIDILNYPMVTVYAEDGTMQEYDLLLYELEAIDIFNLVQSAGEALNPKVQGTIEGNTITLQVLTGTDLSSVVVEVGGLETAVLKINGTEVESGVTEVDLTGTPDIELVHPDGTILRSYSLVVEEI